MLRLTCVGKNCGVEIDEVNGNAGA